MGTSSVLQQPDLGDAYEDLYNILKRMHWEASTVDCKDEVHGVMEEVSDIIDQLDEAGLEQNTAAFVALQGRMSNANKALQKIQDDVSKITRNLSTAASALSAIAKVVSLAPKL